MTNNVDNIKWRWIRYSSVFTRNCFMKILRFDDFSVFDSLLKDYDSDLIGKKIFTYRDYVSYLYRCLIKNYRNEYVYKNSLLSDICKKYGTSRTYVCSEFEVGNSIADMVMFNGTSRVFEIKTELDTDKRLLSQLEDYRKVFRECYLVVYKDCIDKFANLDSDAGLVALSVERGHVKLETIRESVENYTMDSKTLIRCLRMGEYKELVRRYLGYLPEMSVFSSFDICEEIMSTIPAEQLHSLFVEIMKERKMGKLTKYDKCLRQMALSMHLSDRECNVLDSRLLKAIKL